MGHLGIFAQTGVLQLDKAACPDAAAKLTAAAHAGIGADDGICPTRESRTCEAFTTARAPMTESSMTLHGPMTASSR